MPSLTAIAGPRWARGARRIVLPIFVFAWGAWCWHAGVTVPGVAVISIDLGTLGGAMSRATAVNDLSEVVGVSETAAGERHAFLWREGRMCDLGTLGGKESIPLAIDDCGWVAGGAQVSPNVWHAFLWERGRMRDLGVLPGFRSSIAYRIDAAGRVVGILEPLDGRGRAYHGFAWEGGRMRDLGELTGLTLDLKSHTYPGDTLLLPRWLPGGVLRGGTGTFPVAGRVAQRAFFRLLTRDTSEIGSIAHLFTGGKIVELNRVQRRGPAMFLEEATAMNHRGEIVGRALRAGRCHAFLLRGVPLERVSREIGRSGIN